MKDPRECPNCKKEVERSEMLWVKDRYGIPFKLVCEDCFDAVEESISHWELDEGFAGERLEDD